MARKLRNGLLLLLAAVIMTFAAWMLWPRSLTDALDLEGREIWAVVIHNDVEEVPGMDGYVVRPAGDVKGYTLTAESGETRALLDLLDGYAWHPCWATLTGDGDFSGPGELSVTLYDAWDRDRNFTVHSGLGKIRLNGRIVRLGYFGSGGAEALSRELASVLRENSGVAN